MPDLTRHPLLPVTIDGPLATVTFDRPQVRNAFDRGMWEGLGATMAVLSQQDALRCVILRGAGGEAFCAGADIASFERELATPEDEDRYAAALSSGMQSIRLCRHPVIAQIQGFCLGGGAGIATMCDFRVGGDSLRFGITAAKLNLWYAYAEIDPIVQICGTGVVSEMLIEARIFTGREAYEKGLLSRLVADDQVEAESLALAGRISALAPMAARFHKQAIRRLRGPLPITPEEELAVNGFIATHDFRGAVAAFKARQTPVFEGR
jgi:enoyl-CoA hydratase